MSSEQSNFMISSPFATPEYPWTTATVYETSVDFTVERFYSVTNLLLPNPNLLSTHLFRADILFDSASELETPEQKERRQCLPPTNHVTNAHSRPHDPPATLDPLPLPGWTVKRTVVRRLIPRNQQLDSLLSQTCHLYKRCDVQEGEIHLVVFQPHVQSVNDLPFYHPSVRGLAYFYTASTESVVSSSLSLHFLPFDGQGLDDLPSRYHRMFATMLSSFVKFARSPSNGQSSTTKPIKDNILPVHLVQNTYTRLKEKYASNLMEKWVEKTEPAKHVFEDLSIAAFLIELWQQMYGIVPSLDRAQSGGDFPGFVDVACGNGVLVYVLVEEGFQGWGFDARRRKTWSTFPTPVQEKLHEMVCIPKVFLKNCSMPDPCISFHDGIFPSKTFIISNHADELTPWTPILAVLSDPADPLPFLAIPCCSHALDGTRKRYPPKKDRTSNDQTIDADQPKTGDLRAMRQSKEQQKSPSASTYASLTDHVADLANDLGYEVERTLMRIPSTRNIGLIGRRLHKPSPDEAQDRSQLVLDMVERECLPKGGTDAAARTWTSRCIDLHMGKGTGHAPCMMGR